MGIEVLIYCYGIICVSMIVFNCICIAVFHSSDRRLTKKSRRFEKNLEEQLSLIRDGKTITLSHQAYLNKALTRAGRLMAFDDCLDKTLQSEKELAEQYLVQASPVFIHLSLVYLNKKDTVQTAYYAYFLAKYKLCRQIPFGSILEVLLEFLKKDSFYCRQNAMKALYSSLNDEAVVEAVTVLDGMDSFYHAKILTDGLLTFEGDHKKLISLLWERFDQLGVDTQVAVLNYIRLKSGAYRDKVFHILLDNGRDSELHYAAIRYLGRYPYEPARSTLQAFASDTNPLRWNYASCSASSLAFYPGSDTVTILKKALGHANWYVRYNAAQSLDRFGLSYSELVDIMNGNDRYAREMIAYRIEARKLKNKPSAIPKEVTP